MYIYDDDLKYLLQLAKIFELFKKSRFYRNTQQEKNIKNGNNT